MAGSLERMAERRMLKARAEGQLEHLEGEGKPLPDRSGEAHLSAGEAVGFRMMAAAGVLPEEIVLKKQVEEARAQLAAVRGTEGEKAAMARLSELMMKQAIAEEARRKFLKG
ncbi:DUF1992 domain-containing protein [Pseudothioclava arenosa]|uniref:DUF1992 domain-containing protein n=1 Tax=Pseudothioclava arenosa TaxID=1795308 RepID=A0A2A4CU59_9RHOB|nr:DUF1992 domain-containing protein [Pseudothioclava arenosa]PCD77880.1 DUF1992 domain-containing protein [Pseudothioclava arenosa]